MLQCTARPQTLSCTQLARTQLAGTLCDLTLCSLARLARLTRISIGSARVKRTSLCATCSCWPRSGWCRWRDSNCSSRITRASKIASSPTWHARADPVNGQKDQKQGMQRASWRAQYEVVLLRVPTRDGRVQRELKRRQACGGREAYLSVTCREWMSTHPSNQHGGRTLLPSCIASEPEHEKGCAHARMSSRKCDGCSCAPPRPANLEDNMQWHTSCRYDDQAHHQCGTT